jgi:hypothetical protein
MRLPRIAQFATVRAGTYARNPTAVYCSSFGTERPHIDIAKASLGSFSAQALILRP